MKKNKRGISLVLLVVTIVVMIIVAGAGIVVTNDMLTNSKKATFAEDLRQVQDLVQEYYVNTNTLPIAMNGEEKISFNKQQFIDAQDEYYKSVLQSELIFNNDESDKNVFYKVDLAKIGVESISRGADTEVAGTDIYVVSEDTMTVYYFPGYEIDEIVFYSLTDKLVDLEKIEGIVSDNSAVTITDITDISVKKSTELVTNVVDVTISGTLAEGETLRYKISGQSEYTTISALPITVTINGSLFTSSDMVSTFNAAKQMVIENAGTSQSITVDLSNLDIEGPVPSGYTVDRTANNFNIVNVEGTDIKNFYYEYVTKIENGSEVAYYESIPTITASYLKSVGKKTDKIVLDKNIQSISVVLEDDAGNLSVVYNIDNISID